MLAQLSYSKTLPAGTHLLVLVPKSKSPMLQAGK